MPIYTRVVCEPACARTRVRERSYVRACARMCAHMREHTHTKIRPCMRTTPIHPHLCARGNELPATRTRNCPSRPRRRRVRSDPPPPPRARGERRDGAASPCGGTRSRTQGTHAWIRRPMYDRMNTAPLMCACRNASIDRRRGR